MGAFDEKKTEVKKSRASVPLTPSPSPACLVGRLELLMALLGNLEKSSNLLYFINHQYCFQQRIDKYPIYYLPAEVVGL